MTVQNTEKQDSISRRSAMKMAGAGAVALTGAPTLLLASEKAEVMGKGNHRYELVKGWCKLPKSKQFGNTHAVCEVSDGRIFVHNQSEDAVAIFDPDGKFIKSWGKEFKNGAHGMQLSKEGGTEYLYFADYARHIVVKTTLDGEELWTLNVPMDSGAYEKEEQYRPTNVAIAANGDFYIADGYGQSWVHQYNAKAEYVRSWGGKGSELGKLSCPHGIWIDTRGNEPAVVIADRSNVRLQYFSLDGKALSVVTDDLLHPCHFDQREGDLLIPDLHGRVTIFDKNNKLITHLGETPNVNKMEGYPNLPMEKRVPGKFISPHGACWDSRGNVYVAEWVPQGRVTKLQRVS